MALPRSQLGRRLARRESATAAVEPDRQDSKDPQQSVAPWPTPPRVSALAVDSYYEGLLAFRGDARVDGEMEGEIVVAGTVWIGERAYAKAKIDVDQLVIAGAFSGEATARERIELLPTARVEADLQAPRLIIHEGSYVRGRCNAWGIPEAPSNEDESVTSSA